MERNEIKQKIIYLLTTLIPTIEADADIFEYVDLIDDLGMDSITFISIVVEIESMFEITVPDDMLLIENFRNVDGIIQIIEDAKSVGDENSSTQEEV